jgi:hypothetical protein
MEKNILKVTGLSGEKSHYINMALTSRIDLMQLDCTVYRFYVHAVGGNDLDIMINSSEAKRIQLFLEG